jgi:hypothetical protein
MLSHAIISFLKKLSNSLEPAFIIIIILETHLKPNTKTNTH